MEEAFSRTELLIGSEGTEKLAKSRVAVFGLGGVGGYCAEALARAGVGAIDLIDHDKVSLSNLNRQIYALRSTVGQYKADVAAARIADINPACTVRVHKIFYLPETPFDFHNYDYIADCIDTVAAKLAIVKNGAACGVPVISAMGAGNKKDPTMFEVADIFETEVCPLARTMRRELKKMGIGHLKVVYSREEPQKPLVTRETETGKPVPGSLPFVPPVMGLILAGEIIKDLIRSHGRGDACAS